MLELYREEAVWLVNRLKHHPSILMWCGGNEVLLSRDFQYPGAYCYGEKIFKKFILRSAKIWIRIDIII